MSLRVTTEPVRDASALGPEWRGLEDAADTALFRGWTWTGCLAVERFDDALLLRASRGGRTVGLALLNRQRRRLWLHESGDSVRDAPFIEYNGPLLARDEGEETAGAMIGAALRVPGVRGVTLSGIGPDVLRAATGAGVVIRSLDRPAPRVGLDQVRARGTFLDGLSANTRAALRRSLRRYAEVGPLRLEKAEGVQQAMAWLEALVALHAASWAARGQAGAFATPFAMRFHRTLVATGVPRGEVEILRASAGDHALGYLYNLRAGSHVMAYQSGFDHVVPHPHAKPGLTAHCLAIERALAAGDATYDFLAGEARYKRSLSNGAETLHWVEVARRGTLPALLARLRGRL